MEKIPLNERENLEPNSRKRKCESDEGDEMLNGHISPEVKSSLVFVGALPEVCTWLSVKVGT